MPDNNTATALEDVFDALVASEQSPDGVVLARWINRYPQFEHELIDFVTSWTLMESAAALECQGADLVHETLVLRGMSVVQNILHDKATGSNGDAELDGLLRSAHKTLTEFASVTQLGEIVLRKLDRRLIRFASIPERAMQVVAKVLGVPVTAVSRYLQKPSSFARSAHYHSLETPTLAHAEDFADAVRSDPTMAEADRSLWLAETRL